MINAKTAKVRVASKGLKPLQEVRPKEDPDLWSCYYGPRSGIQQRLPTDEIAKALASGEGTLWVDVDTRKSDQVALLKDLFKFHPLAIEDTRNQHQRPKVEEYPNHLFLILNPGALAEAECAFRELDVFVAENLVVTVDRKSVV